MFCMQHAQMPEKYRKIKEKKHLQSVNVLGIMSIVEKERRLKK